MGWRHWAEVVWHDSTAAKFIGDMPHTWVGSDFLRSVLDFFAYEREADDALVLGDGLADAWVREAPGVSVDRLRTYYGPLSYTMRGQGDSTVVRIASGLRPPAGGIVVRSPGERTPRTVQVNGRPGRIDAGREIVVRRLPATVIWRY